MTHKQVNVIFCDDIRHEVGNKFSLMGCYSSLMYVPSFPFQLSKLCVHTEIRVPIEEKLISVEIKLRHGGRELARYEMDFQANPVPMADLDLGVPPTKQCIYTGLTANGLELTESTIMQVEVVLNGESLEGGKLVIRQFPSEQ